MKDILTLMRPKQWTKNLIVFAGLIFAHDLFDPYLARTAMAAFVLFCLASSAIYIFNDILDRERDRHHPVKRLRPIAAGRVSVPRAAMWTVLLAVLSVSLSWLVNPALFLVIVAYVALMVLYSLTLKQMVILDVMAVAAGFVLRAVGGAVAIGVYISPWLIVCTILLALFLGLSKRRAEITALDEQAPAHRPLLTEYSTAMLDQMIAVVTASTVVSYCLYTMWPETVHKFGTQNLILTVPFVLYGIFRYLYLVYRRGEGGSPETVLLNDRPLLLTVALWILAVVIVIYATAPR